MNQMCRGELWGGAMGSMEAHLKRGDTLCAVPVYDQKVYTIIVVDMIHAPGSITNKDRSCEERTTILSGC